MSRSIAKPISTHPIIFPGSNVRWKQVSTKNPPTPPSYPILTLPKCVLNVKCNLLRRETGRSVGTIFGDQLQGDEMMCLENVRSLLAYKRIDTSRPAWPDLNHGYRALTHWTCL